MWRQDPNLTNLARLHQRRALVWIHPGNVPEVAIFARLFVRCIPDRAGVVEVVGEQDLHFAI